MDPEPMKCKFLDPNPIGSGSSSYPTVSTWDEVHISAWERAKTYMCIGWCWSNAMRIFIGRAQSYWTFMGRVPRSNHWKNWDRINSTSYGRVKKNWSFCVRKNELIPLLEDSQDEKLCNSLFEIFINLMQEENFL